MARVKKVIADHLSILEIISNRPCIPDIYRSLRSLRKTNFQKELERRVKKAIRSLMLRISVLTATACAAAFYVLYYYSDVITYEWESWSHIEAYVYAAVLLLCLAIIVARYVYLYNKYKVKISQRMVADFEYWAIEKLTEMGIIERVKMRGSDVAA